MRGTFEGGVHAVFSVVFVGAAVAMGEDLVLLLGCLVLGCAAGARWLVARNLAGLIVRREVPERVRAGAAFPVSYLVQNPRRRAAIGVEVRDRPGSGARPINLQIGFASVPPGVTQHRVLSLTLQRRGWRILPRPRVHGRFPLGLFEASAWASCPAARVLVRPAEGEATPLLRRNLRGTAEARRRPSARERGLEVLHGVREFRDGDDPRRIHWRTTARRGQLVLTEWRREEGLEVLLLLGRSSGAGRAAEGDFERAVSAAATVWRAVRRTGAPAALLLGTGGRGARVSARRLEEGLDALALVRGQAGRRPRAALAALAAGARPRVVVYVSAGPEPGLGARLAAAAGRGGTALHVRADRPEVARFVRGLP